jgi:hypothetical protein
MKLKKDDHVITLKKYQSSLYINYKNIDFYN